MDNIEGFVWIVFIIIWVVVKIFARGAISRF